MQDSVELSLKASVISYPRTLFLFLCLELWHEICTSFHGDLRPKKLNSLFLFPLTKRVLLPALGFWPIIWPLLLHPVMQFIRTTIRTSMSPSLSTRLQSVSSSWLSFWPGFVASFNRQAEELTYIPYSSFNGQSLGPVNSNMEGYWGNWSHLSPLRGRPRDTGYRNHFILI